MLPALRRLLPVIVALVIFSAALHVLREELHAVSWHQLTVDVVQIPVWRLIAAVTLTAVNYAVLTGYDFLAFAYIGRQLPPLQVAIASFLSYAVSNNIGFAMLSGASVRYRFYSRWGLSGEELARCVFSYSGAFWLGLLALGGISLAAGPHIVVARMTERVLEPLGWILLAAAVGYVSLAAAGG